MKKLVAFVVILSLGVFCTIGCKPAAAPAKKDEGKKVEKKVDAPKGDEKKADAPKVEEKKADAPKAEEKKAK